MHDAKPSNRVLKKAFSRFLSVLIERYGRDEDCTHAQIARTVQDLRTQNDVLPYLCAAFLSKEEYRSMQGTMPSVDWNEVQKRSERILREIRNAKVTGDKFYESDIGFCQGGDAHQ
jgi:hypothetical protein